MPHPFDQHYFHGGGKVGGYAGEGYRDYHVHDITAQHVLARKPESVLELGCARGYVLKRIEDAGVRVCGLEISEHCYLTRVVEPIFTCDITKTPWQLHPQLRDNGRFDLCVSVAVLEHIPEDKLPAVFAEMTRTCKRGLHGIDVHDDDGFDKTHCTIRPIEWWRERLPPGHEAVDKEELEQGSFVAPSCEPLRLNLGSFTTMFYGWMNVDVIDLTPWALHRGYAFAHATAMNLPFGDSTAALIYSSHMLEHLSYEDGVKALRECRRVLQPDGLIRVLVPDTELLVSKYLRGSFGDLDELSAYASSLKTDAPKLHGLLAAGHAAFYDWPTLREAFCAAGFPHESICQRRFRESGSTIMKRETVDMYPDLSLIVEATP